MPSRARRHQLTTSLIYHAFNRSINRAPIFQAEEDRLHFVQLLRTYKSRFLIKIYHWTVMLTHFHLLLEMEDPREISRFMAGLNRAYTHYHHKVHGTSGFLWQGRFGLQPIQKETYLMACGRYIERNPVRANIVSTAHEYSFSSARCYCKDARDGITDEDPTFERFGPEPAQRRARYIQFLCELNLEEEKLFRNNHLPAGDDNFKRRLQLINGRYLPRGRGKPCTLDVVLNPFWSS